MTNPMRGEATIELAGEQYACRLNVDALIKIETELDSGILAVTQKISNADVRLLDLSVILYHALRGGGSDLTQKDIKNLIQNTGIFKCTTEVATLLVGVLTDPQAEDSEKK